VGFDMSGMFRRCIGKRGAFLRHGGLEGILLLACGADRWLDRRMGPTRISGRQTSLPTVFQLIAVCRTAEGGRGQSALALTPLGVWSGPRSRTEYVRSMLAY
jgi:hypothetical protein